MATAHEKMTVCLRTDQSVETCRAEMHKACMSIGTPHCSMMNGKGEMGMRNGMRSAEPKDSPKHEH
jgi:hypothetical protein